VVRHPANRVRSVGPVYQLVSMWIGDCRVNGATRAVSASVPTPNSSFGRAATEGDAGADTEATPGPGDWDCDWEPGNPAAPGSADAAVESAGRRAITTADSAMMAAEPPKTRARSRARRVRDPGSPCRACLPSIALHGGCGAEGS
jgi:hypothetical protein